MDTHPYTLTDEAAQHLGDLVGASAAALAKPISGTEKLIADLYTGRDVDAGSILSLYPLKAINSSWKSPETSVNLMLSRIQQIVSNLVPSKPTFHVRARVAGAARLAESQNKISQFLTDHGGLRAAVKRAAFIGMMSPYFGLKFVPRTKEESRGVWDRVCYEALEARNCGYEPFQRRFLWHSYGKQWGDLPKHWRAAAEKRASAKLDLKDWDIVRVTEVYHEGFRFGHAKAAERGACPMSVFIQLEKKEPAVAGYSAAQDDGVGDHVYPGLYVTSENVRACPLVIESFNEPAPNEDAPPAEVATWVPHIRKIVQTYVQINREVRNLNTLVLYDREAVSKEHIDSLIQDGTPSETVYIPVDGDNGERGVNATMRPVEQSDNLGSLLAVLQNDLAFFDDLIGLGPMERGIASNPRKSATEAQSITANANRRNRARLEVIAHALSSILQAQFAYQRDLFGASIDVPGKGGIAERLDVPDPSRAQFVFEVDAVELGHATRQGDADALFNGLTVVSNTLATFQGAIPKAVRELLRRVLVAQGNTDADALIDLPVMEEGPQDRLMEHLLNGSPIEVNEQDQHQAYIAYYEGISGKLAAHGHPAADELLQAIGEHNVFLRRAAAANINAAAQPNVVPGVSEQGPDNAIMSALLAGEPPPFAQKQGAL